MTGLFLRAWQISILALVAGVLAASAAAAAEHEPVPVVADAGSQVFDDPYFRRAQGFADAMLEFGRDTYGDVRSPAFVSTIDLRTRRMPDATSKVTSQLYSRFFRAEDCSTSTNPMYDVDLYQLLFALSDLTGDTRYRRTAGEAIGWFFQTAQSPATG